MEMKLQNVKMNTILHIYFSSVPQKLIKQYRVDLNGTKIQFQSKANIHRLLVWSKDNGWTVKFELTLNLPRIYIVESLCKVYRDALYIYTHCIQ